MGVRIAVIVLLCFFYQATYGQTGALKGSVLDKNNTPVPFATIFNKTSNQYTTADANGMYSIENATSGKITLEIASVGFKTLVQTIFVPANQTLTKNFILSENIYALQEVEIIGRRTKSYRPDVTFSATRTAAKIKDVAQSIQVVNKELMQDQQIFRVDEVMKNVSGINSNREGNLYMSRGFEVSMDNLNGNKVSTSDGDPSLVQHLERVEVIKGPASALFGVSSPGGVINAVTKKPLTEHRYSTSLTYGSFTTKRAGIDITGPINKQKNILYRVNAGYENAKSFRDYIVNRNYLVVPSFSFVPNDNIKFNTEIIYKKVDNTIAKDQGLQIVQNNPWALPINFNVAEPYDFRKNDEITLISSFNYTFSENTSINLSSTFVDFDQSSLATISTHNFNSSGTGVVRSIRDRTKSSYSSFITSYLSHKIQSTYLKQEFVGGIDFFKTNENTLIKTAYGEENGVPLLDFANRNEPLYALDRNTINFSSINGGIPAGHYYWGIYLQDNIEYKKWNVLLGLRYNSYNETKNNKRINVGYKTNVFIPRLGIVYKATPLINVFASYSQSFQPVIIPLQPKEGENVRQFNPLESFQFEGGLKAELFKKKLMTTLSLYQINRQGHIVVDPTIDVGNVGVNYENLIQLSNEYIRGIEFDASGEPLKNLNITANVAYNTIDVDDERTEKFQEDLENHNPKLTAGIWAKYALSTTFLKGLGFGAGYTYTSNYTLVDRKVFLGGKAFDFPGFGVTDIALFYKINKFRFSLNINNVTNEKYFRGVKDIVSLYPGTPRNFLAQLQYSF